MLKIKKLKLQITKQNILNGNIILLGITGIMQSSMIFEKYTVLIDILKWIILFQGIVIFLMQCIESFTYANLIITTIISALIIYTCICTSNFSFLLICIFLVTAKSISIEKFIRYSYNILKFGGLLHVVLWCINYIYNIGYPVYTNSYEHRISFLFTNPNTTAIKFGWGIVMYVWLKWNKLNLGKIILCFLFTSLVYLLTQSDGCLIVLFFLILVFFRKYKIIQEICVLVSKWCFPVLGILNIFIASVFIKDITYADLIQKLNIFFNQRIAMAYLAIRDNGMTWFGQQIKMLHNWDWKFKFGNYTVDSAFVYLYVCIGVIYFILISIGFYFLARYKDYKVAVAIIIFSLYELIEVHCFYLTNCFVLLLLKCVIFKEKKIE